MKLKLKACEKRLVGQAKDEIRSWMDSYDPSQNGGPYYFNSYFLEEGSQEYKDAEKAIASADGKEWGCDLNLPWSDSSAVVVRYNDGGIEYLVDTYKPLDIEGFRRSQG